MPVYFLIGHGLELAIKSLLILGGTTERQLRGIGHDLVEARRRVVPPFKEVVTRLLSDLTETLNPIYAAKGFEYLQPGFGRVPIYHEIRGQVIADVGAIRGLVEREVRDRLRRQEAE